MAQDSSQFSERLIRLLGPDEGPAVFREICRVLYPEADLIRPGPGDEHKAEIEHIISEMEAGRPLQYVLGKAHFFGLELSVNPSVLIPRPETEELVYFLLQQTSGKGKKVLDLCCGSGCIALALRKKGLFKSVEGLDLSKEALETAMFNARDLKIPVSFFAFDLLKDEFPEESVWDIWVSNPPYVAKSESSGMDERVLLHEPHLALFVPDEDALCFYRRILSLSEKHLQPGGQIFLEINPQFASDLWRLYESSGQMESVQLIPDMSGKQRFLHAIRK